MPTVVPPSRPGSLEARWRELEKVVASDLPVALVEPSGKRPQDWADFAAALTRRFPRSARAWCDRARNETQLARFDEAVVSYRHAARLGLRKDATLVRAAEARAKIARSSHGWGKAVQVLDEGGGYWLIAVGRRSLDGEQLLLERRPGSKYVVLFHDKDSHGGWQGIRFGLRRLDHDRRPELIVQSYAWMSNGGVCRLAVLDGSRGHWRSRFETPECLWDVPIVDLDHDGRYELGLRDWVVYHGPIWTDLYGLRGHRLTNVTRRYPALIGRQAREVREALRDDEGPLRPQHRADARAALARYGLRL